MSRFVNTPKQAGGFSIPMDKRAALAQMPPAVAQKMIMQMMAPKTAQLDSYDEGGPASSIGAMKAHQGRLKEMLDAMSPEEIQMLREYDADSQRRMLEDGGTPIAPEGYDDRQGNNSFVPGAEYQTADMSKVKPSGVGETNQLHGTARAFQGLMKSFEDYETLFNKDGDGDGKADGSTMWPGKRKDALSIAHRDLQMQMKELYNLGVLNGPDLGLMNQILIDPTTISGNVMDALGVADMEERIPANIEHVRELMINRSTPALQQLGIEPSSLMPKKKSTAKMSDADLLKALQGGS